MMYHIEVATEWRPDIIGFTANCASDNGLSLHKLPGFLVFGAVVELRCQGIVLSDDKLGYHSFVYEFADWSKRDSRSERNAKVHIVGTSHESQCEPRNAVAFLYRIL